MLAHLGENRASQDLMNAIEHVTSERQFLTPDCGGSCKTLEVARRIAEALEI